MIKLKKKGEELEIPKFLRNQGNGGHKDKKRKKRQKATTYGPGRVILDDDFISITDINTEYDKKQQKYRKQAEIRENIKWAIINIIKDAKIALGPRILYALVKQQVPEANTGQISRQTRNLLQKQIINKNAKRKITEGQYFKTYARKRRF